MVFAMDDQPDLMVNAHVTNCGQYAMISAIKGNDGKQLLYVADLQNE